MNNKINDEIDLIKILKKIYNSKKIIFYTSVVFVLTGIVVAILSPVKFSSKTIFIPQFENNSSSSISGVANLVGLNLGSSSQGSEILPSVYPLIGNSAEFKRLLLNKIIEQKTNLSLKDFIINYYDLDEDNKEIKSPLLVSKNEELCFKIISDFISIEVNQKDGFVTITSTVPSAKYSALVANFSRDILQEIIIKNKIEKAQQNLKYTQEQLKLKRNEFNEIQLKLSYFKDSNLNLVNSQIMNQQDILEAEFEIINSVVTELSKQVEQAKLQVKKDTPVFSTINEALIPNVRISPNRTMIVITFGFIGFILSTIFVIIKKPLKTVLSEIRT